MLIHVAAHELSARPSVSVAANPPPPVPVTSIMAGHMLMDGRGRLDRGNFLMILFLVLH